jgi:zinc and cadmium transporter
MESNLWQVIFFSLIGGVFSLVGGVILLAKKTWARGLAKFATPFAAGALLAAAFCDLLPEAEHEGDIERALIGTLAGILGFFLVERFLHWFHHHHGDEGEAEIEARDHKVPLIIIGDTLHNALDGVAIAAAFLVSPSVGIITTLAVAAHEIPQEIGDFGLLLHKGLSRGKTLLVNFLSALATLATAVVFWVLGQNFAMPLDFILGLIAGFFVYIAVSDIIPDIHAHEKKRFMGWQSVLLIAGAIVVAIATETLHHIAEV